MTRERAPGAAPDSGFVLLPCEGESLGAFLRRCREARGETVDQVARAIRVPAAYLAAIEEDRPSSLPGRTYFVGFARAYARHVDADEAAAVTLARAAADRVLAPPVLTVREPAPERRFPTSVLVGTLVVLGLTAYASWYWQAAERHVRREMVPPVPAALLADASEDRAPSPPAAAPAPAGGSEEAAAPAESVPTPLAPPTEASAAEVTSPEAAADPQTALAGPFERPVGRPGEAVAATPPPRPDPAGQARIRLTADQDSWIEIRDIDTRQVVTSQILRAGASLTAPSGGNYRLTTGNAGGLTLVVDGKPLPHLAGPGAVVRNIPLDPDLLGDGWTPAARR